MQKLFRVLFWVALTLGCLTGLARLTAIRWWRVPTNDPYLTASLSPSLRAGDLILLWRLTKPGFSNLVMCPEPRQPGRVIIGRIVGRGRDEIEVNGDEIKINRRRQTVESDCVVGTFKEHDPETGVEVEQHCSIEDLQGRTSLRGDIPQVANRPADVKTTVPEGQYWLVSDNRLFPYDSRDYGPVPAETCTETVFFRLVSQAGFADIQSRNQFIK